MQWLFDYLAKFLNFFFSLPSFFSCVFKCVLFIHRLYNNTILIFLNFNWSIQIIFFLKKGIILFESVYISYFKTIPFLMALNISPTQTPHTFNDNDHSLVTIIPTLPHLSPNVAGASAIRTLGDSPTRPTAETQGSHHHLAILKKFNK